MNNQSLKKMKIKPKTLSEIVTSTGVGHIDFFSLDVEGHEMQVLYSYDWTIPIHSIFVESNNNFQELSNFLKEKGYHYIESITNNFLFFNDTFMQIYSDNQ